MERDPLSNRGTSRVFYQLARGNTTPSGVAEALGTKSPNIIQQVHRLEEADFVCRGRKEGKFQHYEIRWSKVARAFLKRSLPQYPKPATSRIESLPQLADDENFKTFLSEYFSGITSWYEEDRNIPPIKTVFDSIKLNLREFMYHMRGRDLEDEEAQEVLEALETWRKEWGRTAPRGPLDLNFEHTIYVLGLSAKD